MSTETSEMKQDLAPSAHPSNTARRPAFRPAVDVFENKDGITLVADLPGVSQERLDLQVEADQLTIEAEASFDLPEAMATLQPDAGKLRFRRVFTLGKELDAENVSADLKNGVLTLRIPKAAHAQPRKIAVQAG